MARDGFRDCDRFDAGFVLQAIVETAQKFAARLRVVFPGIFAVENDRDHRIAACIKNRLRRLLNVIMR